MSRMSPKEAARNRRPLDPTDRNQDGLDSPSGAKPRLGRVKLIDTTCRDGEQMPGISFTCDEKVEIALGLEGLGVEQIETFATYNDSDRRCAAILSARLGSASLMGWNRMVKADVDDSVSHGVDAVSVSTDTSDIALANKLRITRAQQIEALVDCVEHAKAHGVYVCFNAGDATRTDSDYLVEFARAGLEAGGDRFRICDTVGVLTPSGASSLVSKVMSSVGIDVEFHAHNDFGLAVANALAACEAAAAFPERTLWLSTTVNGLGERAGNVPLEVLVMNLRAHYGVEKYGIDRIVPLCRQVEKASGLGIPPNYPVVGRNMFTHKSGIHVDGVLKNPALYEAFDPGTLGLSRRIAIGKHSGKASVRHKLDQMGLSVPGGAIEAIRREVSASGERKKRDLTDAEFARICSKYANGQSCEEKRVAAVDANIPWGD